MTDLTLPLATSLDFFEDYFGSPRFALPTYLGNSVEAGEQECNDPDYRAICAKYGIRMEESKPLLFTGGFTEWSLISSALDRASLPKTAALLHAALIPACTPVARGSYSTDVLGLPIEKVVISPLAHRKGIILPTQDCP